jgi:hypothetical protein
MHQKKDAKTDRYQIVHAGELIFGDEFGSSHERLELLHELIERGVL